MFRRSVPPMTASQKANTSAAKRAANINKRDARRAEKNLVPRGPGVNMINASRLISATYTKFGEQMKNYIEKERLALRNGELNVKKISSRVAAADARVTTAAGDMVKTLRRNIQLARNANVPMNVGALKILNKQLEQVKFAVVSGNGVTRPVMTWDGIRREFVKTLRLARKGVEEAIKLLANGNTGSAIEQLNSTKKGISERLNALNKRIGEQVKATLARQTAITKNGVEKANSVVNELQNATKQVQEGATNFNEEVKNAEIKTNEMIESVNNAIRESNQQLINGYNQQRASINNASNINALNKLAGYVDAKPLNGASNSVKKAYNAMKAAYNKKRSNLTPTVNSLNGVNNNRNQPKNGEIVTTNPLNPGPAGVVGPSNNSKNNNAKAKAKKNAVQKKATSEGFNSLTNEQINKLVNKIQSNNASNLNKTMIENILGMSKTPVEASKNIATASAAVNAAEEAQGNAVKNPTPANQTAAATTKNAITQMNAAAKASNQRRFNDAAGATMMANAATEGVNVFENTQSSFEPTKNE